MNEQPAIYAGDYRNLLNEQVGPDAEGRCWVCSSVRYHWVSNTTDVVFTEVPRGLHELGTRPKERYFIPVICGDYGHRLDGTYGKLANHHRLTDTDE